MHVENLDESNHPSLQRLILGFESLQLDIFNLQKSKGEN